MSISVILPIYWRGVSTEAIRFLDRALASVFDQTHQIPFEIIVVDDGSQQPVSSVIASLRNGKRPEIRWLRSERNNGLVYALNRGILAAQYGLIARLDADDRWLPDKLGRQLRLFDEDEELTIVATGMTIVDEEGKEMEQHVRAGDWNSILRFFVDVGCPFPHGSVVAKRRIFRLLGGYCHGTGVRHCEDYELWGRWLRFFKPSMVEESLYEYTWSRGSVSAQNRGQQSAASGLVQQSFRDLGITETLPQELRAFASSLGTSLLHAGIVAYRIWSSPMSVNIPRASVEPLRALLPDRDVRSGQTDTPSCRSLPVLLYEDMPKSSYNVHDLVSVIARAVG